MKSTIFVLFFLFIFKISFSGCHWVSLSTTNGIRYTDMWGVGGSSVINMTDSLFTIFISGNFSCNYAIKDVTVRFNDSTVFSKSETVYSQRASILASPGHYIVKCQFNGNSIWYGCIWEFDLISNPKNTDTTSVEQTTNILSIPVLNPEFVFYPNPAKDLITLLNETDEIKKLAIYNSTGDILIKQETNSSKVTIPLNNYPPGIYFIQVTTLSDKIIIKKIVVL